PRLRRRRLPRQTVRAPGAPGAFARAAAARRRAPLPGHRDRRPPHRHAFAPRHARRRGDHAHDEGVRAARVPGHERRPRHRARGDRRARLERGVRSVLEPHRGLHRPAPARRRPRAAREAHPHPPRLRLHPGGPMIRSIRGRLTTWYSVVMAVVLVATGAISYGIMRRQIRRSTDAALTAAARQVAATLRDEAAENHGVLLPRFVAEVLNEYRDRDRPVALFTR